MKKSILICLAILLLSLAGLCGCVTRERPGTPASADATPGPEATSAPTPEPTPTPIPFEQVLADDHTQVVFCGSYDDAFDSLEAIRARSALTDTVENDAGIRTAGTSVTTTDALGDKAASNGAQIYLLSGSDLYIIDARGADSRLLSKTRIGIGWNGEEDASGAYRGREKVPTAVFSSGTMLAVISDWYGYNAGDGSLDYSEYVSVDILDVSDPASPVVKASLGQDGTLCSAGVRDGALYAVSRFEIYEDAAREDLTAYIPSVYSEDRATALAPEKICLPQDGSFSGCSLIGIYDMAQARLVDVQALFGVEPDVCVGDNELLFHSARSAQSVSRTVKDDHGEGTESALLAVTDLFVYGFDANGLTMRGVQTIPGRISDAGCMDLYNGVLRALIVSDRGYETLYNGQSEPVRGEWYTGTALCVFNSDRQQTSTLEAMPDGSAIGWAGFAGSAVLLSSADGVVSCTADLSDPAAIIPGQSLEVTLRAMYIRALGDNYVLYDHNDAGKMTLSVFDIGQNKLASKTLASDYSSTLENYRAYLTDAEANIITLTADDSYCIYGYSPEDGIILHTDVYLNDWAWNARGVICGDSLYVADMKEVFVYSLDDFKQIAAVTF